MLKYVSYQMYVCWSVFKISDVCNVCMLKCVSYQMYVEVCVSYQMYVMYVCVCWCM